MSKICASIIFNYSIEGPTSDIILVGLNQEGIIQVGFPLDANLERIVESRPQLILDAREERVVATTILMKTLEHMMYIISTVVKSHSLQ